MADIDEQAEEKAELEAMLESALVELRDSRHTAASERADYIKVSGHNRTQLPLYFEFY
jgi:hypothetical protein